MRLTHDRAVRLFNVAGLPGGSYLADSARLLIGDRRRLRMDRLTLAEVGVALGQEIAQAERGYSSSPPMGRRGLTVTRAACRHPGGDVRSRGGHVRHGLLGAAADAQITNMVTATSASGGSSTAVDYDSITDNYGILSSDITLNVDDAAQGDAITPRGSCRSSALRVRVLRR